MKSALVFASTALCSFILFSVSSEYVADTVANLEDNTGSSQVGTGRRGDIVNMQDLDEQMIVNIDSGDVLGFDSAAGGPKSRDRGVGGRRGDGRRGESKSKGLGDQSDGQGRTSKGGTGPSGPIESNGNDKGTRKPNGKSKDGRPYHVRGIDGDGKAAENLNCDAINAQCQCNQINGPRPKYQQQNVPDVSDEYPIDYIEGEVHNINGEF